MEITIKMKEDKLALSNPDAVMKCINNLWDQFPEYDKGRENMFAIYLNVKNELISVELHCQGTIDQSIVYPREIIRKGLYCNAAGVILMHNHPSGHTWPSSNDKSLTKKIKESCRMMDINLLDHIIIADGDEYYSFQAQGLI